MVVVPDIAKIMSTEGPIIKAVVLKANGEIEEVTIDMTPSKFAVNEMLGGTPTFVGQYVKIGAVVMARRDDGHLGTRQEGEEAAAETIKDKITLPLNEHIPLRAPLDTELVAGDMVLIRMDEEGEPVDLTLSEYTMFKDTIVGEDEKAAVMDKIDEVAEEDSEEEEIDEDEGSEDEGVEESEESDDGDDEEADMFHELLFNKVVTEFAIEHGREPTEEELKPIFERLNEALASKDGKLDDEPDIDDTQVSQDPKTLEEPVKRPASIEDIPAVAKKAKTSELAVVS
eukprot:161526_1